MRSYLGLSLCLSFCLMFTIGCGDDETSGTGGTAATGGTGGTAATGGTGGSGGTGGTACIPPVIGTASTACRNSFNQALSEFPVDLDAALDDCPVEGETFNAHITPTLALGTEFLNAAAGTLCDLGITLEEVDLNVTQVRVDALIGATCTSQLSELSPVPQTVMLDVTITGTCGAGGTVTVDSPIAVPLPEVTLPCTAGAAPGPVGFCATGTTPSNTSGADEPVDTYVIVFVTPFAVNFACGDGTVSEASDCTDDADCTEPGSTCDLAEGTCTQVVLPLDPAVDCITFPVEPGAGGSGGSGGTGGAGGGTGGAGGGT